MGACLALGLSKLEQHLRMRRVRLFNVHFSSSGKLSAPLNQRRNRSVFRRPKPTRKCSWSSH